MMIELLNAIIIALERHDELLQSHTDLLKGFDQPMGFHDEVMNCRRLLIKMIEEIDRD